MICRREFTKTLSQTIVGSVVLGASKAVATELEKVLAEGQISETQSSGDDMKPETLNFSANAETKAVEGKGLIEKRKDSRLLAAEMLRISGRFADLKVGRLEAHPKSDQVLEFLSLFEFDLTYAGTDVFVPFCAAGVSYAACRAFCNIAPTESYASTELGIVPSRVELFKAKMRAVNEYYFRPSPSVRIIVADAKDRGVWVDNRNDPLPGWLVVFTWKSLMPNHIGIVESVAASSLQTVEYNTAGKIDGDQRNGGIVARRTRSRNDSILGFVKVY